MSRGGVVIVAAPGDYSKPRPAVIVQSDAIPGSHASVVICPMTSETAEADFRITISRAGNGAAGPIADNPETIRRERIGPRVGRLGAMDAARLNVALALVMGLADYWMKSHSWYPHCRSARGESRPSPIPWPKARSYRFQTFTGHERKPDSR